MLRQPSQSSTMSVPTGVISGLMIAIGSVGSSPRSMSSDATNSRTPFVDLRRREADAVILGHRVDHVVDELLDRPAS